MKLTKYEKEYLSFLLRLEKMKLMNNPNQINSAIAIIEINNIIKKLKLEEPFTIKGIDYK